LIGEDSTNDILTLFEVIEYLDQFRNLDMNVVVSKLITLIFSSKS
jgi:hypothetical protein